MHRSCRPPYTTGTFPTAAGWSISPAGTCPSNTPRLSKSIWRSARPWASPTSPTWAGSASRGPARPSSWPNCLTRRVADMELGQIRYSLVTNTEGGILDDVLVGYYHNSHGQPFFLVVVNASNRAKIVDWVHAHLPPERMERPGQEIVWNDVSRLWAMFAIQGPRSVELLQPLVDVDLRSMRYYRGAQALILHPAAQRQGCIISRTGYTGEDGFELSLGASIALGVWEVLLELGPAVGHRAHRPWRPRYPAARGRHAPVQPRAFRADQPVPGRPGLRLPPGGLRFPRPRRAAAHPEPAAQVGPHRAGNGRQVAPPGKVAPSSSAGRPVGHVTSGSYSPTLGKPIAMGYVAPEFAQPGTELQIDIRGHVEPARVVELPFYRRNKKGPQQ